jgi:iron complex outermembrane receptor protein
MRQALCLVIVATLAFTSVAVAEGSGSIVGTVTRDSGSGIGGVVIVINETAQAELTDSNGNFAFSGVPEGSYSLSFTLGDNTASEQDVEVTANSATRVEKSVDWDVSFAETITVTSASRRVERIVDAPAAVTVVTAEEIQRQASHGQVPKVLEFTPGAEVTQSGIYDYNFNTRGFNSSLTRRVATLIDGRDPSVPFLGAQEWAAISFPLDDLDSVELVRGPSAALYGANASSGVLNMVTKEPRGSQGGLVRLTAGELSTLNGDFRWAGSLGNEFYVKLIGGVRTHGDFTVSRNETVEYPGLPPELVPLNPEDDDEVLFYGVRLDKHFNDGGLFTVEGGGLDIEGPAFQTGIGRVQLQEVSRPWVRANYSRPHWNFLAFNTQRDASKQQSLQSGAQIPLDTERLGFEAQTNWSFAQDKARVVVGLSFAEEDIDSFNPATGRQSLIFEPINNEKQALFAQLDWNITESLKLVLAGRVDENDLHDSQFSPKASLVYGISPNHTLRFTYNEAFQVANYSEFFLQASVALPVDLSPFEQICLAGGTSCGFGITPILAVGNANLELEQVQSAEIGYSGILGNKAFLTVDYYQSENEDFITDLLPQLGTGLGRRTNPDFGFYVPPDDLGEPFRSVLLGSLAAALGPSFLILSNNVDGSPIFAAVSYTNFGQVDTEGVDIGLNYYVDNNWTVQFSYSWFDFEIKDPQPGLENILLPNTPENKASGGVTYAADRWDAGLYGRWVEEFFWAVGPFQGLVESYVTFDLNANYDINDSWSLGLQISNLFDDEHWQSFGGDILGRRALGNVAFTW